MKQVDTHLGTLPSRGNLYKYEDVKKVAYEISTTATEYEELIIYITNKLNV